MISMDTVGRLGEDLAAIYLKNQGYKIISCNFRTKFGELDIVCRKGRLLVFVEVKAVVSSRLSSFSPEQHFTKQKIIRLKRAIEIFLIKNKISDDTPQRLDLAAIELDENGQLEDLRYYENVSDVF